MRILLSIVFAFLLCQGVLGQTKKDTTYYPYGNEKRIQKIETTSGDKKEVIVFHENGKRKERFTEVNGKKNGKYQTFDYKGNLYLEVKFENGNKQGKEVVYFPNGKKRSVCSYVNNVKMGRFTTWNEKGLYLLDCHYDTVIIQKQDKVEYVSVLTGEYTSYFPNGVKETEYAYQKGKLDGLCKDWYANGNQKSEIAYKQGLVYGKRILWYENGQKKFEGFELNPENRMFNGEYITYGAEGKQTHYYASGMVQKIEEYKDKIPHGDWLYYNERGVLTEQRSYFKGQLSKNRIVYYDDKVVRELKPYEIFQINGKDTGLLHGKLLYYHTNGKLSSVQTYVKGNPYGITEVYREDGNLERQLFVFGDFSRNVVLKEFSPNGILLREGSFCVDSTDMNKYKGITNMINYPDGKPYYTYHAQNCSSVALGKSFYPNGKTMSETFVFSRNGEDYLVSEQCGNAWQAFYYPNGALWYEVFKVNSFPIGQYIEWFPEGQLKRFINPVGLDIQWFQDGTLMSSFAYTPFSNQGKDTVLSGSYLAKLYADLSSAKQSHLDLSHAEGLARSYYANGKIKFETFVRNGTLEKYFLGYTYQGDTLVYLSFENNKLNGRILVKNENNTPFIVGSYAKGMEVGNWEFYNRIGQPREFYDYSPTAPGYKPYSYEYTFYEDGKIKTKASFSQGKLAGWKIGYHPNGLPSDSVFYMNDTLNGAYLLYTDEGKPYRKEVYKSNMKHGVSETWYYKVNGSNLMSRENYVEGQQHGEALYYHGNGKLQLKAFFNQGKEDSLWIYYDSLGNVESRVKYKQGVLVKVPEELGSCECDADQEREVRFAQRLTSLLEDDVDLSLWQFPFHEDITPLIDKTFFRNLQTNNNRNSYQYSFSWIAFKSLRIGVPKASGVNLILNPCWKPKQESSLEVDVFLMNKRPDQTMLFLTTPRMAYELPRNLLLNAEDAQKPVLASFTLESLKVSEEGLEFNNAKSICMSETYLLNKNYRMHLDTFSIKNYQAKDDYFQQYVFVPFSYNEIPKAHLNLMQKHSVLLSEGKGSFQLKWNQDYLNARISDVSISSHFITGIIRLEVSSIEGGKYKVASSSGTVLITEKEVCQQLMKEGFTTARCAYLADEKVLVVGFYILQK